MELKEKYFLIVSGKFDREPIVFSEKPSDEEIVDAIKKENGESARVEKRFVLNKDWYIRLNRIYSILIDRSMEEYRD